MGPDKKDTCENEESESETISADDAPEQTAQEIHIEFDDAPIPHRNQKIHPRAKIPLVPEGDEEVSDDTPSPPVDID